MLTDKGYREKGENKMSKWICSDCLGEFSGTNDTPESCPICGSESGFWAKYAKSRVRGERYTPYYRRGDWGDSANAQMAARAQDAFMKR
jgi:hypothetical protein